MEALAVTSEAPAGETSGGRRDAMSEEVPLDDSWADGLRPRKVAKGMGKAAGADAEREELLAKLLRLIPQASAYWCGGIATSTLRVMVEVPPGGREGPPPTAESAMKAWSACSA